jgi:hypothetical protein
MVHWANSPVELALLGQVDVLHVVSLLLGRGTGRGLVMGVQGSHL